MWSTNASLPKISYIKSIDVYLVFCFFMTFSSVIEYGAVSFVHRYITRIKKKEADLIVVIDRMTDLANQQNSLIDSNLKKLLFF